ncbi:MAG: sulfur oxidation c-type cytochrome SoxA [Rhizobiales bacterium PAR1]|nr:MAG: sulfur oxidation c-type cytochrome SoxA [Rhizobiales bacterium PAR1]
MLRLRIILTFLLGVVPGGAITRADDIAPKDRRSGFDMMSAETQAMQKNDLANPAMLWVREGEALWSTPPEGGGQACSGCHGEARISMKGVAARYPVFDASAGTAIDLAGKIQQCQVERQKASPWPRESKPLLSMSSYVGLQSRGTSIVPAHYKGTTEAASRGKALFNRRVGQLNLSCANCHDDNWGQKLGSAVIPQGHPTGYPIYRLEWQGMGSLQRRMRNCMTGVRAEPYAYGAPEWIELELYLMQRAAGLTLETPAVRP